MAEAKEGKKGWTDAERIIEKAGPIPWDQLALPEGRTLKACQVMVDKEKQKVKKARGAAGETLESTPKSTPKSKGKRKADGEAETPASSAKKAKGRKKADSEDADGKGGEDNDAVANAIKTEGEEEMPF